MSYIYKHKYQDKDGIWKKADVPIVSFVDLLDDNNEFFEVNRNFTSFRDLYWPYLKDFNTSDSYISKNKEARILAKRIVRIFLTLLFTEIIEYNIFYRFANIHNMLLGIVSKKFYKRSYNKEVDFSNPEEYEEFLFLNDRTKDNLGEMPFIKFTKKWREKLQRQIDYGKRYYNLSEIYKRFQ